MYISESCASCMYRNQMRSFDDPSYLAQVRQILDNRKPDDTTAYIVYLFQQLQEKHFGKTFSYAQLKKEYNDLVLSMEDDIRGRIEESEDPLLTALSFSRTGNYIDFGAFKDVNSDTFIRLLAESQVSSRDRQVYGTFLENCSRAKEFLLIADNCGEIVLDKLFIEQLKKRFPLLHCSVLVRGEEVLNDATPEDAAYAGIPEVADVISNGKPLCGTVLKFLPQDALDVFERADVILSKGQANYEALVWEKRHVFYSLLCKCDQFTSHFQVPLLTGIFVEEGV